MLDFLQEKFYEAGVLEYGYTRPSDINFRQMIRDICAENTCGRYGTTWACPPAAGTVDECRERCLKYDTMFVFSCMTFVDDPLDLESMGQGMGSFQKVSHEVYSLVRPYLGESLLLANESCNTCETCTYPDAPCRFPDKLNHSIESFGLLVSEVTDKAGIAYDNGYGTVTYFGAVLFNAADIKKAVH